MSSCPIKELTVTTHELSISPLSKIDPPEHIQRAVAKGLLVGSFYSEVLIYPTDEIVFSGDFNGFFLEEKNEWSGYVELYFEGRINELDVQSINGKTKDKDRRIYQLKGNTFRGYFKGVIEKQVDRKPVLGYSLAFMERQGFLKKKEESSLIIPAFVRFVLKNINSVRLDQASALVSGDLIIDIKVTEQLMNHFEGVPNLSISLAFNKQNGIELPLKKEGKLNVNDNDITFKYKSQVGVIRYVIRKIFTADLQSSYKQFFTPFNLLYLNIVIHFLPMTAEIPLQETQPNEYSQGEGNIRIEDELDQSKQKKSRSYNESSAKSSRSLGRRGRKGRPTKKLNLKFVCLDLKDWVEENNPYTSYNDLLNLKDYNLIISRITKISFIQPRECGDFRVATNHLALFPFYKEFLFNSSRKNSNFNWNMGLEKRTKNIVDPEVLSIPQEFQLGCQDQERRKKNLNELHSWRYVHIQVPIHKYWAIYVIQICIPLLILSVISMFIFLQANGVNQDGQSVFNLRIANATAVLLAYGAMIPVFRQSTAHVSSFSFFYIVIYLSVIPLILALISSVLDSQQQFLVWQSYYKPFTDPYFLVSFVFLAILLLVVFIVIMVVSFVTFFEHDAELSWFKFCFKTIEDAKEPIAYRKYQKAISIKRKDQFRYREILDIDQVGNIVGVEQRLGQ